MKFQLLPMMRKPEPSAEPFTALLLALVISACLCAGTAALLVRL